MAGPCFLSFADQQGLTAGAAVPLVRSGRSGALLFGEDRKQGNAVQESTLSSAWTFWMKYLFPAVWISGFALATVLTPDPQNKIAFLVMWGLGTTFILWANAGLKRVRMDERKLYVSNYFQEIYVPFSAITDVKQNRWINSRPITIFLRDTTQFGDKVTFMPKQRIQFWSVDPVVNELKRLAGLVAPGHRLAAAESSKIRLSRDFRCRPIFDFCNTICY
jgi:hypothetical protein